MSARGFGSVLWAGAVAGAALGFYLVSLNVASERAELEEVETRIALTQRDIRLLQTEIGTRGRLAQLERWNVKFIRLSAPSADQFVDGGFQLATMVAPPKKPPFEAPVVLASASIEQAIAKPPNLSGDLAEDSRGASDMVHVASYSVPQKLGPAKLQAVTPPPVKLQGPRPQAGKTDAASSAKVTTTLAAAKPVKSALADPLAALPSARPKANGSTPAAPAGGATTKRTRKDGDD